MPQVISNKEISFLYISSRVEGHVEQVKIYVYVKKGQNSFFFLLIDVITYGSKKLYLFNWFSNIHPLLEFNELILEDLLKI